MILRLNSVAGFAEPALPLIGQDDWDVYYERGRKPKELRGALNVRRAVCVYTVCVCVYYW